MRLVAFVYDFCHHKSAEGLLYLKSHGFDDVKVIATPFKHLNIPKSRSRITPIVQPLHPCSVARALNYEYVVCDHDNPNVLEHMGGRNAGVILGARILKKFVTTKFPIINMHPGLLPQNRGLDNIKQSILHNLPVGVTAHIVDEFIDRGFFVCSKITDVLPDDTLLDIYIRNLNDQMHLMIKSLKPYAISSARKGPQLGSGCYFKPLNDSEDRRMLKHFPKYKLNYIDLCARFK